ncbi:MAG: GNAT family N-acetyltransferase [Xanthomonadaceae bacterium]|jgi:ribosomal protein S18 acetylase RimI-like enzyme|nr:GNAT family N-acetyltransferase [Xanthomonadaceae bacterium]MDE3073008.1 GNAT family N-acetyltransferase [Pseudomonadota bacterium]
MPQALPAFPAGHADHPHAPASLRERGFTLRPANDADLAFLRTLYRETRSGELAAMPWPAEAKLAFLDGQFELQHRHYVTFYGRSDFLVVERDRQPVGRVYLLRQPPDFRIVDIALRESARGEGVGSALIAHIQQQARAAGCGVALHVDRRNTAARRLYRRLGFAAAQGDDTHLPMNWTAAPLS